MASVFVRVGQYPLIDHLDPLVDRPEGRSGRDAPEAEPLRSE